jgi:hypothetical protein
MTFGTDFFLCKLSLISGFTQKLYVYLHQCSVNSASIDDTYRFPFLMLYPSYLSGSENNRNFS